MAGDTGIDLPSQPCQPGCGCGKHDRTEQHNVRIGMSVALTAEAKGLKTDHRLIQKRLRQRYYRRKKSATIV